MEARVRHALYWPDGTRRNSAEAYDAMTNRRPVRNVVKALLDKHNEDNHLLGDLAYEVVDIVRYKAMFERNGSPPSPYGSSSHINLTLRTKGADDSHCGEDNLFFAEITCMVDVYEEYELGCIYKIKPNDNGQCYGCTNGGCPDMKHPNDVTAYKVVTRSHEGAVLALLLLMIKPILRS